MNSGHRTELKDMDIVYVCKVSPSNEELRYSLRSLKNIPHRKVWIYGYKQDWIQNVEYVPIRQDGQTKWDNASKQIKAICENDNISEDFILFNDDFFVCRKINELPAFFDRTLSARLGDFLQKYKWHYWSGYMRRLRVAKETLRKNGYTSYNFELHYPMVFNRKKLLGVYEDYSDIGAKRSIYGNMYSIQKVQSDDCKIYTLLDVPRYDATFLSTNDGSFERGQVGIFIRNKFSKPCEYEKEEK